VDDVGQVWTPFTYFRADAFAVQPDTTGFQNRGLGNFIDPEDQFVGRAMPAAGVEYRFPFVAGTGSTTTQVIEPIAQVIARPSETRIGRLPNEDAQSLVFDDTPSSSGTSSPASTGWRAACAPTSARSTA
jgi:LPS-assembly protein